MANYHLSIYTWSVPEEKNLNQAIQDLTKQQQNLQQQITAAETSIQATNDELKNILDAPSLNASDLLTRANFVDLDEQHQAFNTQSETQYRQLADYYQLLANAAEISLRKKGLEARKKKAGERKAQFKESSTEAKLNRPTDQYHWVSIHTCRWVSRSCTHPILVVQGRMLLPFQGDRL